MSKQTRFARAFEPWIAEWAKAGLSGTQTRVLLLLIANMEESANGQFTSWRPRAEMAEILGVSEYAVRNAISALSNLGMIKKVGKAYNGKAQKYIIMPKPKGYTSSNPINDKGYTSRVRKGTRRSVLKGTPVVYPTRTLEGASTSYSRSSAKENEINGII